MYLLGEEMLPHERANLLAWFVYPKKGAEQLWKGHNGLGRVHELVHASHMYLLAVQAVQVMQGKMFAIFGQEACGAVCLYFRGHIGIFCNGGRQGVSSHTAKWSPVIQAVGEGLRAVTVQLIGQARNSLAAQVDRQLQDVIRERFRQC
jgi:hypothetical protein